MEWLIDFGLLSGKMRNHSAGYNDYDQGTIQHYCWYNREPRYGLQRRWSGDHPTRSSHSFNPDPA